MRPDSLSFQNAPAPVLKPFLGGPNKFLSGPNDFLSGPNDFLSGPKGRLLPINLNQKASPMSPL